VADPNSLFITKPSVNKDCILDKEHVPTVSVSTPTGVNTKVITSEYMEVTWDESQKASEPDVLKFRLFISEKDNFGSTLSLETADDTTTFKLKTPKAMWGKDYLLTIQAINIYHKMSLISEPAVFKVANYSKPALAVRTSENSPVITNIRAITSSPDKITLAWLDNQDASAYIVKWDKGDPKNGFVELLTVPGSTIYLTSQNTQGVMGSKDLKQKGGTFTFKIAFINKRLSKKSVDSEPVKVVIRPSEK
jgi:hypothetical protein